MALGGNKKMRDFFEKYDLHEEEINNKYNSCAAEWYRGQLRSLGDGVPFNEQDPSYEEGKQVIVLPDDDAASADQAQVTSKLSDRRVVNQGNESNDLFSTGYEYLSFASQKALETASSAKEAASHKLAESGVSEMMQSNAEYVGTKLADVSASASNKMSDIKKQAEDGSLLANTQESVYSAAQTFAGLGSSWMNKAKGYLKGKDKDAKEKQAPPTEERKEGDPDSPRIETDVKPKEPATDGK